MLSNRLHIHENYEVNLCFGGLLSDMSGLVIIIHNCACITCFPSHHHFDLFQEVILSCVGQGPTVHVQSSQLDFGKIRVLTDNTRLLQLLNQSPIPASFTARMVQTRIAAKWNRVECLEFQFRIEPTNAYITQELFDVADALTGDWTDSELTLFPQTGKKSFWRVEPSEGEVSPGGQLDLSVVANLKDTLRFEDRLEVSIRDNKTHTVPLSATGTGTTITTDRPFAPSLDLGTYFR